ncbi:ABC-2 type transport system ATP-binding protein [Anaerosolibacter carboniphilus]|uniref:ABC-2 type transport system ATP-binding protein n=1 Tax=Anaerosolibacter carboniphilus TaxID=1417629 RepID=A0A841KTZ1_9FIRM|nr:ABC transporter ATP-binding protein [Anaerosolibacter carboniphilus]MBB6217174.1 ABC-2 type transport system ATP-binding protein [Anaerosolibacter carboniphilus]
MYMVEIKNLTKKYGPLTAVDNISLNIETGDLYGLLGPNGAGKSTTISVISTFIQPTSGDVLVGSHSVLTKPSAVRKLIGLVPQDIALYPTLTARENLSFFGKLYGLRGKDLLKKVDKILETVGLYDRSNEKINTYSGGMKRRINIGVGLMNDPKLLILDEPTVGIDPQSRNHILETVKYLNETGMTVIYTSHYMEEVEFLCKRIGIMDHGKLIAQGSKEEVFALAGNEETLAIHISQLSPYHLQQLQTILPEYTLHYEEGILTILGKKTHSVLGDILAILNAEKFKITSLNIQEPNLESVFLHLTGRALRD